VKGLHATASSLRNYDIYQ